MVQKLSKLFYFYRILDCNFTFTSKCDQILLDFNIVCVIWSPKYVCGLDMIYNDSNSKQDQIVLVEISLLIQLNHMGN